MEIKNQEIEGQAKIHKLLIVVGPSGVGKVRKF